MVDQGLLLHAGGKGVDRLVGGDLGLLLTDGRKGAIGREGVL